VAALLKLFAFGAAAGLAARELSRRAGAVDLRDRAVLITGGSRGLGLAVARACAAKGAKLAVCARDAGELERAGVDLTARGAEVLTIACDVSDRAQVEAMVERVEARFGRIDVLVNNAGIIQAGPLEVQTHADVEEAMAVMFWHLVHTAFAVLPGMRARGFGRIANVTSIGGKIGVPHLLPYNCAKFAAVGFSETLRAEVAKDGVAVTTVVPGLMRTGSHVNAYFKGQHRLEYALFSPLASLPGTAVSAEYAAGRIVRAIERGDAELTIGIPATLAARFVGLFPGLTADLLGLVNRALPGAGGIGTGRRLGKESQSAVSESPLTTLGRRAAHELNQYAPAGAESEPGPAAGAPRSPQ
jgi:NAD(P)-dependent dehydrogenase (short-subunit alcohol dehydrogenase family)